jgi:hypothetical protein
MAVVAYPQGLAALLTTRFQQGQRDRLRRLGTRGSPGHGHSPAELFILLLSSGYTRYQDQFSIQAFFEWSPHRESFSRYPRHGSVRMYCG